MAVLIEAISVIIRRMDIHNRYPGAWDQFAADCPNRTLCADEHIARVGFMTPLDAKDFVGRLVDLGFVHLTNGEAVDIAVVDQYACPLAPVRWLEVGSVTVDGESVAACRLVGDESHILISPDGWTREHSLSNGSGFAAPEGEAADRLRFMRHENGQDVFEDRQTGKQYYVGRTGRSQALPDPATTKQRDVH
jgi:hypothetical protein